MQNNDSRDSFWYLKIIAMRVVSFFKASAFFYLCFFAFFFLSFWNFRVFILRDFYLKKNSGILSRIYDKSGEKKNIKIIIKEGQSVMSVLSSEDFEKNESINIVNQINKHASLSLLKSGDSMDISYTTREKMSCTDFAGISIPYCKFVNVNLIDSLKFKMQSGLKINIFKTEAGFDSTAQEPKYTEKIRVVKKVIQTGLLVDSIYGNNSVKASTTMQVIDAYSYLIDFQREIRSGDSFIFIIKYKEDQDGFVKDERIVYSDLIIRGSHKKIMFYKNKYYKADGTELAGSLLKTPIDGARISSGFSRSRKHPILGYSRAHLGVDFAAPIGTYVYAAADGVVTFAGIKGGYGKFVALKHSRYATHYAHLSRVASHIKPGRLVKQKTIIGYVGMTGLTSGPHLHYEVLLNGTHINPAKVIMSDGRKLSKPDKVMFDSSLFELEKYIGEDKKI